MTILENIERRGTEGVRKLRQQKLRGGHPFMINSKDLRTNQCYLEYPNGAIKLVTITNTSRNFDVIRELTHAEATSLRTRYQF